MAKVMIVLDHNEIQRDLPYQMICEGRFGSAWNTMHRKRRWMEEFTESERDAASKIFSKSKSWTLTTGVPESIMMSPKTYALWIKLGNFCASI